MPHFWVDLGPCFGPLLGPFSGPIFLAIMSWFYISLSYFRTIKNKISLNNIYKCLIRKDL